MEGFWVVAIGIVAMWELAWKGWALWRAAQRNSRVWYVLLLVLNTAGILPILYVFVFSRNQPPVSTGAVS